MGQKHNRRRTRPRSRLRLNGPLNQNPLPLIALPPHQLPCDQKGSTTLLHTPSPYLLQSYQPSPVAVAQPWQNRYVVWQSRERQNVQGATKLEAEQFRLFGGEPGDDIALCYRMLEYFGGLDYIDP